MIPSAYVDVSVKDGKVYANYQFERLGFFTVDKETTADKVSFLHFNLGPGKEIL